MKNHARKLQSGMTLLEVLIATSILAVISALAFLSIDNMVKAKSTLNEHTEQLNRVNLALYLLQNDLQFAYSSQQNGLLEAEFTGNSQGFTLLQHKGQTVTSPRIERSPQSISQPLQKVRWHINSQQLVRSVLPAYSVNSGTSSWQPQPLLEVSRFSCAYINDAGNRSGQWPNSSFENALLPRSIQCLITTESDMDYEINITPWQKIW
jgi:type II secretion system protein J